MIGRNDILHDRRAPTVTALSVLLVTVAFATPLQASEAGGFSREVVVGDASIGVVLKKGDSAFTSYGILDGLASATDGEVSIAEDLVSLTARGASTAQSGAAVLPWEEAEPMLAQVLANHDHFIPVLPDQNMRVVNTGDHSLLVPSALITSARRASRGLFDVLAKRRSVRRKLYEAAVLRAVALEEALRFDERLAEDLASWQSGAVTMLGVSNAVASDGLTVYTEIRTISGIQSALQHGASTADVAAKVTNRISASNVAKSVQALGVLAFAVDLAQGVSESRARQKLLAAAAADALVILSLEDARSLLEVDGADPAMIDGIADAIGQLTSMSQSRLEEYATAGTDALAGSVPSLAGMTVAYLASGGVALVVREAAELVKELFGYTKDVLTLSAMVTLGDALSSRTDALMRGDAVGGTSADAHAIRELVVLHDRLSAEGSAWMHNMLWGERWKDASSLAGIGKGVGITLAEWLTADVGTEEKHARQTGIRVGRVRDSFELSAALPEILAQLRNLYVGPPAEVGEKAVDIGKAERTRAGRTVSNASFSGARRVTSDIRSATSVFAADLDGDGDLDALSASEGDGKIAWYENLGDATFAEQRVITTDADGAAKVSAADLDGDGDIDVLSASAWDDKIAWYENLGGGAFTAQRVITTNANHAISVYGADLDGDGDADVLSAAHEGHTIAWFENLGGGTFSGERVITADEGFVQSVFPVDLDGDGRLDVLSASPIGNRVSWYRNLGNGAFSDRRIITPELSFATAVFAADLDDDGDPDVVAASYNDEEIGWYENLGGGFVLSPAHDRNGRGQGRVRICRGSRQGRRCRRSFRCRLRQAGLLVRKYWRRHFFRAAQAHRYGHHGPLRGRSGWRCRQRRSPGHSWTPHRVARKP